MCIRDRGRWIGLVVEPPVYCLTATLLSIVRVLARANFFSSYWMQICRKEHVVRLLAFLDLGRLVLLPMSTPEECRVAPEGVPNILLWILISIEFQSSEIEAGNLKTVTKYLFFWGVGSD